jgi:uncharacterized Zn finger protein (UPF0148 family)
MKNEICDQVWCKGECADCDQDPHKWCWWPAARPGCDAAKQHGEDAARRALQEGAMLENWEPWDTAVTCPQCGMVQVETVWPVYQGRMVCRECGELFFVEAAPCYRTRGLTSHEKEAEACHDA